MHILSVDRSLQTRRHIADVSEPDNGYVFPLDRDGSDGESQKLLDDEDNLLSRGMGSFILHQTLYTVTIIFCKEKEEKLYWQFLFRVVTHQRKHV